MSAHLPSHELARRAFLKRAGHMTIGGAALPLALNLAAMGEAAAFNASDYKALVCVFLQGGNDHANTVVSYDSPSYDRYSSIRGGGPGQTAGGIAIGRAELAPTLLAPTIPLAQGRQYALHPAMPQLAGLFNSGKAAVLLNVGPLVVPLTKAQYNNPDRRRYPLPPKLFSHNDQVSVWQSSSPEGSTVGWGGNLGDIALSGNANALFTCISAAGNSVFLAGESALQYQVSTNGAVSINPVKFGGYGGAAVKDALAAMIQQPRSHRLENEYNRIVQRSISAETLVNGALAGVNLTSAFSIGNPLGDQLKIVARLIGARNALGSKRQVFFVALSGFDRHDNLISQQTGLMLKLSDALASFYSATVELGVADKVTAFTASDFGRTLSSNGDGSDHGWGGHHFIVGGAVKGKALYGTPPPLSITDTAAPEDQWHVGQGRLLPTTSVDQYAATLARWFGVADTEMSAILPNLVNFGSAAGRDDYPTDLGFLA